MLLETWVCALILIITGLYIYYKLFVFTFWRKKGVYNEEPTFPIGNMLPLLANTISNAEFFKNAYDQHKEHRLLGIYMLHRPYLIVTDPDLIRDVLVKEFINFHDRGIFYNPKTDPLSDNLFQMSGKKWRNLRVKLTPTFTSGKIKQTFSILKETGDTLNKFLDSKAELKESIDVKDVFTRYSLDVIMSTAFGMTCDTINNPNNEFRYLAKKILEPKILWNGLVFFAPQVFDLFSIPYNERRITKFFTTVFQDTIKHRQSNDIIRKDFLDLLMQLMKDGYVDPDDESVNRKIDANTGENKLSLAEATAQAYAFCVGGFETSSMSVTYCLYELAKHHDIQDKLRDEIRTVIEKHGGITYSGLNDMPYLHKVVSEAMRKHPVASFIIRTCTKETMLETTNVSVPAGTPIIIPVFGLHRDPQIYPEPEKFDPERFSEENIKSRHPYVYLPFGEGPRMCIGFRFGMVQVKVAVINTLLNHRIKLTPDTPDNLEYLAGTLGLVPKGGVYLNIETVT